jgi:hypothetical protein
MTTQTPPTSEPTPAPAGAKPGPAKAATLTPQVVKPKKTLFGGDSKAGRALRAVVRTVAFIVGFFALGFFTAYMLLYRPVQLENKTNILELNQARQDLEQKQTELDRAALTFLGVEAQNKQLTADLEKTQAQLVVANTLNKLAEVNLKLAANDTAAARLSLEQAEKLLNASLPQLEKLGAAQSDTLSQLFTLVRNDLNRDTRLAQQDLERLNSELLLINDTLAK